MTPDEHLDAIIAFIDRALQTCAKRTPGEWEYQQDGCEAELHNQYGMMFPQLGNCEAAHDDADFIASASIGYEAALRSTKAAIEALRLISSYDAPHREGICPYGCDTPNIAQTQLTAIRAEWPIEKLK